MAINHRRVADAVFDHLHDQILAGDLAPQDRLDPTQVAETLGVSRTPVREAILQLEAHGLVRRIPYTGVVVTGLDEAAAEDVAAMRIELETLAVRVAIPRLTDEDVAAMADLHRRLTTAIKSPGAQEAFGQLNREFHLRLYQAAGSPTLVRLITELSDQAQRLRLRFDVRRGRATKDHARILAACRARDVEETVAATRDHIFGALVMMMPRDFAVRPGSVLEAALLASGWTPAR